MLVLKVLSVAAILTSIDANSPCMPSNVMCGLRIKRCKKAAKMCLGGDARGLGTNGNIDCDYGNCMEKSHKDSSTTAKKEIEITRDLSKSFKKCVATTRDMLGPFYEGHTSHSPTNKFIAPPAEIANTEHKIMVEGSVLDMNCKPIPGADVHVWYAGGTPVHYTFPPDFLWYRGFLKTDANGKYSYVATYPGTYDLRPIIHVHYRIITPTKELVTQLYFKDDVPPQYEDYVKGRESQFPSKICGNGSGRNITFNIVMDYA